MKSLQTRFSLALSVVLLAATLLPLLLIYILGASGLVEVTYVAQSQEAEWAGKSITQARIPTPATILGTPQLPWMAAPEREQPGPIPGIGPETGQRSPVPPLGDPMTGQLISRIPPDLQRVVLTSPVFKFRIDMPAWLVLGSLPLFSLLIGILLSVLMSRSVTRPVSQLAEAAQAIGRRDLSYRVEAKGSQELQELAQSFNRMAQKLEQSESTRRTLMADVAHELRTPLAVLDGNLRAMLDGVHGLNEEEVSLLYEQTHHLSRLVSDLRELSLAEAHQLSLDLKDVDLTRLVNETVAHFDFVAREQGIQLAANLDDPLVHPRLDESRVRQVLHNLLSNAFRHTPRGGQVAISARQLLDTNTVQISVSDTGSGISPEDLPHIFDRFYRTEKTISPDRGRTGLGLAIVKAIIEMHGGIVEAHSEGKGRGTTISVLLPMVMDERQSEASYTRSTDHHKRIVRQPAAKSDVRV